MGLPLECEDAGIGVSFCSLRMRRNFDSLHFLRRRSNVSRSFNNALSAVVVLVQFCAKAFEHGHDWRRAWCACARVALLLGHGGVRSFDAHL
jgi:hypothetical protein